MIATPRNASHRWCVSKARASTGSPSAATGGHHEPHGTWTGAGGAAGGSGIGSWWSVLQRGSRLATVGIAEDKYGGGGEGIVDSSVSPPPGAVVARAPC